MDDKIRYEDIYDQNILKRLVDDFKKAEKEIKAVFARIKKDAASVKLDTVNMQKLQAELQRLTKLEQELKAAKDAQVAVNKQLELAQKRLTQVQQQESQAVANTKEQTRQLTREQQLNAKVTESEAGSINRLKSETNKLNNELNKLNLSTKEGQKQAKAYQKQILANEKQLKKFDAAIGRHQRNVGNYRSAMGGLTKVLGMFGVALGGVAVVSFGKDLLKTATALEQVDKRARIVFGNSFPAIESAADRLSKKMGVTASQFINAAAATGDLLIPLDFTRKQAADMSIELQSLSGALDEWTGGTIGVTEVSNILTKAMLGENEQLKRLGIAIRQDSEEFINLVKQKQIDEGVTKAQARAMATLELIQKKSADAQTAYSKSGTDLVRIQKSVVLWWNKLKEGIAQTINPVETSTERLQRQREELRLQFKALKNTNTSQDTRRKIIEKINTQYGQYLPNLLTEKTSLTELSDAYDILNKKLLANIIAKQMSEELKKYNQGLVDMAEAAVNAAPDIERQNEAIAQSGEAADKTTEALKNSAAALEGVDWTKVADPVDNITEKYQKMADILKVSWDDINDILTGGLDETVAGVENLERITIDRAKSISASRVDISAKEAEALEEIYATHMQKREDIDIDYVSSSANILSGIAELRSTQRENELQDIESQRAYELELAAGNKEKEAEINEKYDRQQAEIKTKQAKADKRNALFQSIINTAAGVAKAIPNPFLIAFAALIGAIQQATILSTPIPQFFKGVESSPEGFAWTGEKGFEIKQNPDGTLSLTDNKAQLEYLEKGTKVIPHERSKEIIERGMVATFGDRRIRPYDRHASMKKLEELSSKQIQEQQNTNKLLGNYRYSIKDTVYDLKGNKVKYV